MLKKIKQLSAVLLFITTGFTSCQKALDINTNPNDPTVSTPDLVLPQAMVATSQLVPQYSTYGGRLVGYYATSGGVGGWSDMITYDFTTSIFSSLWSNTYNVLMDLQYVINNTKESTNLDDQKFNQAAQVLRAYNFANLVDTYNDIPYTQALQGTAFLTPKYDKAQDVYVDLATRLDAAIAFFKSAGDSQKFGTVDIIFKGNVSKWAKFANTLKLKLVLRAGDKANFANKSIDAIGVIDDDVIVQPVFTKIEGKQNPMWNTWAYVASGNSVGGWGTQFIPTQYVMSFYDGYKLDDAGRADLVFANGVSTNKNQLGQTQGAPNGVSPSAWVQRPGSGSISATNYRGTGVIKGPKAGQPIMLAAESNLLAAEGVVRGVFIGEADKYFKQGIIASYLYLNKNEDDQVETGVNGEAYFNNYLSDNEGNPLVDFALAVGVEQKIEAIVTQKFIAFNFLFGHEAWNEFRRTGYPSIRDSEGKLYPNNVANARNTFVSTASLATSEDKLPTRILYPNTEFSYNAGNVPSINKYATKIFWAK